MTNIEKIHKTLKKYFGENVYVAHRPNEFLKENRESAIGFTEPVVYSEEDFLKVLLRIMHKYQTKHPVSFTFYVKPLEKSPVVTYFKINWKELSVEIAEEGEVVIFESLLEGYKH